MFTEENNLFVINPNRQMNVGRCRINILTKIIARNVTERKIFVREIMHRTHVIGWATVQIHIRFHPLLPGSPAVLEGQVKL